MTTLTTSQRHLLPVARIMAAVSFSVALLTAAPALTINPPVTGTTAAPGTTLALTVTPSGAFTQVILVGEGPIGYSSVLPVTSSTPSPYPFSVSIPAGTSPGTYALTALGVSSSGNATSAPLIISVERTDAPVQFDVTPITLNLPVGERVPLRVIGTYADGTKLDITHSVSTTFSSNSGAASVDAQGYVTAVRPGTARILVNNSLTIPVLVPPTLTVAPEWPILYGSQSIQFSAFKPGIGQLPIVWTITPQTGSISRTGVYTAPKTITTQTPVNITATLQNDATKSISTGIALYPPVSLSIFPNTTVTLTAGQTQRFSQTVNNALDEEVDWSIAPKTLGTIDNTGLYTAPATVKSTQTVVVTATSIADPTKTASVSVSLH